MAKTWVEWETSLNQGVNPAALLGVTTENPETVGPRKIPSNLTVPFEGEEFLFCMSRVTPPSLNRVADDDVLITKPSIPFDELFSPLLVDPQPQNVQS